MANSQRCVIKILKPVKKKKIRREIKILQVCVVCATSSECVLCEGGVVEGEGGVQGVRVLGVHHDSSSPPAVAVHELATALWFLPSCHHNRRVSNNTAAAARNAD